MAEIISPIEKYRQLSLQCDIAAYQVLGAARVLARMAEDKITLELIAKYDRHAKALADYARSDEFQNAKNEVAS